jgi:hypothetical protein
MNMFWFSETATAFPGCEMICSVCHKRQVGQDIVYIPRFTDNKDDENRADQIEMMFGVDPFNEFIVCENCMEGHCGVVPGKTANTWLAERVKTNRGGPCPIP